MEANEIKRDFPQDFQDLPDNDLIGYFFGSRQGDLKNFRISAQKVADSLGIVSLGGAPIYYEGTQLPSLNNANEPVKKGDWLNLTAGLVYVNINGGPGLEPEIGFWSIGVFDGNVYKVQKLGQLPSYNPTGGVNDNNLEAPSGQAIYRDIFNDGNTDLQSLLVNKGKRYPLKNYFVETTQAQIRLKKSLLKVIIYCNDSDQFEYSLVLVAKEHSQSGERIDIKKKIKGDLSNGQTYSFRTIGTGSADLSDENRKQLEKLLTGDIEAITLIANDNSFKAVLIFDTSEFISGQENLQMTSADWNNFVFQRSVYRTYDNEYTSNSLGEINDRIDNLEDKFPVVFTDTGIQLDMSAGRYIGKTNGAIINGGSAHVYDYNDFDATKKYYFTGEVAGVQGTGVAFRDADDNFISIPNWKFDSKTSTSEPNKIFNREPIPFPPNAKQWALASWGDNFKIEVESIGDLASKQELDQLGLSVGNINTELNNVNDELQDLNNRVTSLENTPANKIVKSTIHNLKVSERESYLRGLYNEKIAENPSYVAPTYNVNWNEDNTANVQLTRGGTMSLHQSLPIQSKIRSCVVKNNIVQYYLYPDNDNFKEDGVTPSKLDGTDGDVLMEIPEGFWKWEDLGGSGNVKYVRFCEEGLPDYKYSPKHYIGKYKSTIDRETNRLASVCTTEFNVSEQEIFVRSSGSFIKSDNTGVSLGVKTVVEISGYSPNASRYRGVVNDSSLDGETNPASQNYSRNQLGRPVSNINRKTARQYAENSDYLIRQYDSKKFLNYLIWTEYATRNLQQPINNVLTPEGYKQGGLGWGATVYPDYNSYEAFFSPQGGNAVIPAGVCNTLGTRSGEVYFLLKNVPVASTGSGASIVYTEFADVYIPVNKYRGIEDIYGQLYEIVDNIDTKITNLGGGVKRNEYWYQPDPYLTNDTAIKTGYKLIGAPEFVSSLRVITKVLGGSDGHILPIAEGGTNYNIGYCAMTEQTTGWNGNTWLWFYSTWDGRLVSKTLVDQMFSCMVVNLDSNRARTSDGVRLQTFIY